MMNTTLSNSKKKVISVHKSRDTAETALEKRKKKNWARKSGSAIRAFYGLTSRFIPGTMLKPVIMQSGVRVNRFLQERLIRIPINTNIFLSSSLTEQASSAWYWWVLTRYGVHLSGSRTASTGTWQKNLKVKQLRPL